MNNAKLYYAPCDSHAIDAIWESVLALAPDATKSEGAFVEINRRQLAVRFVAEDVVWFDFDVICGDGRAAPDYIEIAKIYHTVVVTGLPNLGIAGDDSTRRFLHLVDEFYDRSVNLILGADVSMDRLYASGRLAFEMERCCSRLLRCNRSNISSGRIDRIDKRLLRKVSSITIIRGSLEFERR